MISEFIYMLPSDLNLRIGKVQGYNNKILVLRTGFKIGTNLKINLDVKSKEVEMVRTEPDVKPKVKTKPNIEPNKNTNKMLNRMLRNLIQIRSTVRKKGSFGIRNNVYLYSMVDVQMTYLLLVFVMKYVYIKTPTPVMRAHRF